MVTTGDDDDDDDDGGGGACFVFLWRWRVGVVGVVGVPAVDFSAAVGVVTVSNLEVGMELFFSFLVVGVVSRPLFLLIDSCGGWVVGRGSSRRGDFTRGDCLE